MLAAAPWGAQAKLIGQDLASQYFPQITGKGQSVAIIDSGVDYNHPQLGGGWGKKVVGGWDFMSNDSNPMSDSYAHGTGTAAAAAASAFDFKGYHYQGIAPGANVIALRQNKSVGVEKALAWVIANKAKYNIVSVNITDYGGGGSSATYKSINAKIAQLNAMNVYVTSPSGNGGAGRVVNNTDPNQAIVGSVNKSGGISGFTQRGPGMDFLAPAEKITLPYYDTGSKKHILVDTADGTSWAAPQIAGAAALIRQVSSKFTNGQISSILADSGVKTYDGATKRSYPRLNLYAALKLAYQRAGQQPPKGPTPPPITPGQPGGVVVSGRTTIGSDTTIQAEDFDAGNDGQAYHDTTGGNQGGNNYRNTGVDIVSINDQGSTRAVGFTKAGEWLKYSIKVTTAGTYSVDTRLSALKGGGTFHIEVDGKNVTGAVGVPQTNNWNAFTTVTKTNINLTAGDHTVRVVFDKNGGTGFVANVNSLRFYKGVSRGVPSTPTAPTTSPFKTFNVAAGAATTLQAEDFDNGGFFDKTANNQGGQYRNTGVDVQKTNDAGGGYNVGFLQQGEWLSYTVNVTKAGTFNLDTRLSSLTASSAFHVEVDGKNIGQVKFANTKNFQSWTTVRKSGVSLTAGTHTIKIVVDSTGGKQFAGNINWFKLS